MRSPTLSICIATRNRSVFLEQTLQEFAKQTDNRSVEIVVVDGNSTDGTCAMVHRLSQLHPQIRLFSQTVNGGLDSDFDFSVVKASGKYCWLFSDDDLPAAGAVDQVLGFCETGDYDFLYVNSSICSKDDFTVLAAKRSLIEANIIVEPGKIDELFELVAMQLCFIGSYLIRREVWLERDRACFFGTYFMHIGVLFQRPLHGKSLLIADPLVKIRAGNASWNSKAFEIWNIFLPRLLWGFEEVSDRVKQRALGRYPWRSPLSLAWMRAKGHYKLDDYHVHIKHHEPRVAFRSLAFCIAIIPKSYFSVLALFLIRVFRPSNHYLTYEVIASRNLSPSLLSRLLSSSWRRHIEVLLE